MPNTRLKMSLLYKPVSNNPIAAMMARIVTNPMSPVSSIPSTQPIWGQGTAGYRHAAQYG